jgi:hypothetical protein
MEVGLHPVTFVAVVPLNVTVPEAPKLVPLMMTGVLAGPELGDIPLMFGSTMKGEVLLSTPPTVTTTLTLPAVAKAGTVTAMEVSVQVLTTAVWVPNFTVLVPCDRPKLLPLIVTDEPTAPEPADRLLILGGGTTVKLTPGLVLLPTVTVTLPVTAPLGTVTVIEVSLQL